MSSELSAYKSRKDIIDEREFHIGEIYKINDQLISLPAIDRLEKDRLIHEERWVVVVHSYEENINPLCPVVTVAPLSHRIDLKRPYDLPVFKDQDDVKTDSLVQLKLLQPVLKVDLGEFIGSLSEEKIEEMIAIQLLMIGIDDSQ